MNKGSKGSKGNKGNKVSKVSKVEGDRAAQLVCPADADALHAWIVKELGVTLPREALLSGSSAPFEYVCHAFFEGRVPGTLVGERPAVDCVVWANRGGGKTFLGALVTLLDLVFKPGIEIRVLGGSLEQSRRLYEHLRRFLEREALAALVDGRSTDKRVRLKNGSRVEVLAQSQAAVRGTRVQKIRCDEVDLFDREVWEAAQLTTRSMRCAGPWGPWVRGSVEALSTMHRPMGLMWDIVGSAGVLAGAGEATGHGRRRLFRWGVVDSLERCGEEFACEGCALRPECDGRAKGRSVERAGHVPIVDALAMKARVSAASWDAEMLCLRPKRSDAVLPEFDERVHVVEEGAGGSNDRADAGGENPAAEGSATHEAKPVLVAGMDFGFRAPTVVLWATHDEQGVVRVTHERVVAGETIDKHIAALLASSPGKPAWIGVDPAGNQRNDQTGRSNVTAMRQAGLVVRHRVMSIFDGLNLVRARLRPADATGPRLFIHRRCARLIESLQRYRYPEDRPESIEPVKDGSDHAVDALRYLIVNLDRPSRASAGSYV